MLIAALKIAGIWVGVSLLAGVIFVGLAFYHQLGLLGEDVE